MNKKNLLSPILISIALIGYGAGCQKEEPPPVKKPVVDAKPIIPQVQMADWCREHGVPESVCTRCNSSLVDGFKKKGDWCAEHGLPESQCFICHPDLKQQFADQYKSKYGKEPPSTEPEAATQ